VGRFVSSGPPAGPLRYVPPPPRRRSVTLLWWGGGLLVVAAVVALVLVLLLRDADAPAQTPKAAAEQLVQALDSGDCEALTPSLSTRLAERIDCESASQTTAALAGIGALNITFGTIDVLEESADEARVSVEVTVLSTEGEAVLVVIQEDGGWVVDDLDLEGTQIPLLGFP